MHVTKSFPDGIGHIIAYLIARHHAGLPDWEADRGSLKFRLAEAESGENRTLGRKFTVPKGLYRCHDFISAPLAKQTGFSERDLELFWQALLQIFDHDRSVS